MELSHVRSSVRWAAALGLAAALALPSLPAVAQPGLTSGATAATPTDCAIQLSVANPNPGDQEIPHSVAVEVAEYKERSETLTYISANIYVERDSQKGILIGKSGAMLKKISSEARVDLEKLTDTQVYLELWVKVLKNWRQDEALLRRLGYRLSK